LNNPEPNFNGLSISDYFVVALYLVAVFAAGFLFTKNNKSGKDFFVGGNRIPWWAAGVSLYMSTFSAWMFTGAASFVYNTSWFGVLFFVANPLGFVIGFLLSAVKWRRARLSSPVEYVEERYNHTTRLVIGAVLCVSMLYWPGQHLAAVARISAPALFPDVPWAVDGLIIFFGFFVLLYSVAGGIWAVSMTDVLQFIVLLSVCVVLLIIVFFGANPITPAQLVEGLPPFAWEHTLPNGAYYTPLYMIGLVAHAIFGNAVGDKAQRFFLVKDEKAAKRTGWMTIALYCMSPFLFGLPPLVGKFLWPEISQLVAFAGSSKPEESIFIAVVVHYLPAGIVGLFIAAMIAASMSALDSVWNTLSSIISIDLYKGHFRKDASQKELLWVGRVVVVCLAVAAIIMAEIIVNSSWGLFTFANIVLGLVGIPVSVPLLTGVITRIPSTWAAIPSILSGIAVASLTRFDFNWALGPQYITVVATTFGVLMLSKWLGGLHNRSRLHAALGCAAMGGVLFVTLGMVSTNGMTGDWVPRIIGGEATALWLGITCFGIALLSFLFTPVYGRDITALPERTSDFYKRIARPVDVAAEVGEDLEESRPNRIIGWSAVILAFVPLVFLALYGGANAFAYLTLAAILFVMGGAFLKASS
jgi:Na+/proline symporter